MGIISSEIITINKEEIISSNKFSELGKYPNIEQFIHVDHSGTGLPDPSAKPT